MGRFTVGDHLDIKDDNFRGRLQLLETIRDYYLVLLILGCFNFVLNFFAAVHLAFRFCYSTKPKPKVIANRSGYDYDDDDEEEDETHFGSKEFLINKRR